jgi:hypothetical protein
MNGWTNHATWNFRAWHGDQLDAYAETYAAHFDEISLQEVAEDIEAWAWEETGMNEMPIGFARDAASHAFHDINWTELAELVKRVALEELAA